MDQTRALNRSADCGNRAGGLVAEGDDKTASLLPKMLEAEISAHRSEGLRSMDGDKINRYKRPSGYANQPTYGLQGFDDRDSDSTCDSTGPANSVTRCARARPPSRSRGKNEVNNLNQTFESPSDNDADQGHRSRTSAVRDVGHRSRRGENGRERSTSGDSSACNSVTTQSRFSDGAEYGQEKAEARAKRTLLSLTHAAGIEHGSYSHGELIAITSESDKPQMRESSHVLRLRRPVSQELLNVAPLPVKRPVRSVSTRQLSVHNNGSYGSNPVSRSPSRASRGLQLLRAFSLQDKLDKVREKRRARNHSEGPVASDISMKLGGQMSPTNFPGTPDKSMSHGGTPESSSSYASLKHSKRESYKAQKKNYRSQKKEAAKELLSTITDPAVVLLGDWLKVRGTLKSWTKLWCVLKPGVLVLYKSDKHKGSQWVGTILLNTCQLLERPSKKDGFCFKLFHPLDQSIWATKGPKGETIGAFVQPLPYSYCIFRAPSESAGKCWMDALELALKCTNLLKRSMTRLDNTADTSTDLDLERSRTQDVSWRPPSQNEDYQSSHNGNDHLPDGDSDVFPHAFNSMRAQERSMNESDLEKHFANQGTHTTSTKKKLDTKSGDWHLYPAAGKDSSGAVSVTAPLFIHQNTDRYQYHSDSDVECHALSKRQEGGQATFNPSLHPETAKPPAMYSVPKGSVFSSLPKKSRGLIDSSSFTKSPGSSKFFLKPSGLKDNALPWHFAAKASDTVFRENGIVKVNGASQTSFESEEVSTSSFDPSCTLLLVMKGHQTSISDTEPASSGSGPDRKKNFSTKSFAHEGSKCLIGVSCNSKTPVANGTSSSSSSQTSNLLTREQRAKLGSAPSADNQGIKVDILGQTRSDTLKSKAGSRKNPETESSCVANQLKSVGVKSVSRAIHHTVVSSVAQSTIGSAVNKKRPTSTYPLTESTDAQHMAKTDVDKAGQTSTEVTSSGDIKRKDVTGFVEDRPSCSLSSATKSAEKGTDKKVVPYESQTITEPLYIQKSGLSSILKTHPKHQNDNQRSSSLIPKQLDSGIQTTTETQSSSSRTELSTADETRSTWTSSWDTGTGDHSQCSSNNQTVTNTTSSLTSRSSKEGTNKATNVKYENLPSSSQSLTNTLSSRSSGRMEGSKDTATRHNSNDIPVSVTDSTATNEFRIQGFTSSASSCDHVIHDTSSSSVSSSVELIQPSNSNNTYCSSSSANLNESATSGCDHNESAMDTNSLYSRSWASSTSSFSHVHHRSSSGSHRNKKKDSNSSRTPEGSHGKDSRRYKSKTELGDEKKGKRKKSKDEGDKSADKLDQSGHDAEASGDEGGKKKKSKKKKRKSEDLGSQSADQLDKSGHNAEASGDEGGKKKKSKKKKSKSKLEGSQSEDKVDQSGHDAEASGDEGGKKKKKKKRKSKDLGSQSEDKVDQSGHDAEASGDEGGKKKKKKKRKSKDLDDQSAVKLDQSGHDAEASGDEGGKKKKSKKKKRKSEDLGSQSADKLDHSGHDAEASGDEGGKKKKSKKKKRKSKDLGSQSADKVDQSGHDAEASGDEDGKKKKKKKRKSKDLDAQSEEKLDQSGHDAEASKDEEGKKKKSKKKKKRKSKDLGAQSEEKLDQSGHDAEASGDEGGKKKKKRKKSKVEGDKSEEKLDQSGHDAEASGDEGGKKKKKKKRKSKDLGSQSADKLDQSGHDAETSGDEGGKKKRKKSKVEGDKSEVKLDQSGHDAEASGDEGGKKKKKKKSKVEGDKSEVKLDQSGHDAEASGDEGGKKKKKKKSKVEGDQSEVKLDQSGHDAEASGDESGKKKKSEDKLEQSGHDAEASGEKSEMKKKDGEEIVEGVEGEKEEVEEKPKGETADETVSEEKDLEKGVSSKTESITEQDQTKTEDETTDLESGSELNEEKLIELSKAKSNDSKLGGPATSTEKPPGVTEMPSEIGIVPSETSAVSGSEAAPPFSEEHGPEEPTAPAAQEVQAAAEETLPSTASSLVDQASSLGGEPESLGAAGQVSCTSSEVYTSTSLSRTSSEIEGDQTAAELESAATDAESSSKKHSVCTISTATSENDNKVFDLPYGYDKPETWTAAMQATFDHFKETPNMSKLCPKCVEVLARQDPYGKMFMPEDHHPSSSQDSVLSNRPMFHTQKYKVIPIEDLKYEYKSGRRKEDRGDEGGASSPAEFNKGLGDDKSDREDTESTQSEFEEEALPSRSVIAPPEETNYILCSKEELGQSGDDCQTEEVTDENKSLIWMLVKQVRPGMDLSKVVLPTFILEPRSFLDKLSDYYYHADILSGAVLEESPYSRMKSVVRWYLSGFYKKPKGLKKPYNPVIGEAYRCCWHHPSTGSRTFYIAEQVSHHPPVSVFHVTNRKDGFNISGSILARSKFYGNSLSALLDGVATLSFLERGEDYYITMPYAHCKGILIGTLTMELGGKVTIDCPKTGYKCDLEFKLKPFLGSGQASNRIHGKIRMGTDVLATIDGHWDQAIYIKDHALDKKKEMFWNPTPEIRAGRLKRFTVPAGTQLAYESEKMWSAVSKAVVAGDMQAATDEKYLIEEEQRRTTRERKQNNTDWVPRYFEKDELNVGWIYKFADDRPWDAVNDVYQYEKDFVVQTQTRHKTPHVRAMSLSSLNKSVDKKKLRIPRTVEESDSSGHGLQRESDSSDYVGPRGGGGKTVKLTQEGMMLLLDPLVKMQEETSQALRCLQQQVVRLELQHASSAGGGGGQGLLSKDWITLAIILIFQIILQWIFR